MSLHIAEGTEGQKRGRLPPVSPVIKAFNPIHDNPFLKAIPLNTVGLGIELQRTFEKEQNTFKPQQHIMCGIFTPTRVRGN